MSNKPHYTKLVIETRDGSMLNHEGRPLGTQVGGTRHTFDAGGVKRGEAGQKLPYATETHQYRLIGRTFMQVFGKGTWVMVHTGTEAECEKELLRIIKEQGRGV